MSLISEKHSLPILIVDDDEPTRGLLMAVLRRSGYESELASDGAEAIALLREREYTAVILDLMMPAVSGHDVIEFLTAESRRIPVVVCTAAGGAHTTGFDTSIVKAVIRKPFDIEQLLMTVQALVS